MLAFVSSAYFLGTLALGLAVIGGSLWESRGEVARALGLPQRQPYRPFSPRVSVKRRVRMAPAAAIRPALRKARAAA
ncbi:hypothetical protein [Sphingomonas sp. ID0503]|uniref:hypothetical protein n=1 Tax=Sphingomonas sp. ID0503 TaxID=3399691 RepID=UPI003AFB4698